MPNACTCQPQVVSFFVSVRGVASLGTCVRQRAAKVIIIHMLIIMLVHCAGGIKRNANDGAHSPRRTPRRPAAQSANRAHAHLLKSV